MRLGPALISMPRDLSSESACNSPPQLFGNRTLRCADFRILRDGSTPGDGCARPGCPAHGNLPAPDGRSQLGKLARGCAASVPDVHIDSSPRHPRFARLAKSEITNMKGDPNKTATGRGIMQARARCTRSDPQQP